jgi:hypothetical protein
MMGQWIYSSQLSTRDTEEVFDGKLGAFAFMSAGPFIRVMLVGVATVLQIHPARGHCALSRYLEKNVE